MDDFVEFHHLFGVSVYSSLLGNTESTTQIPEAAMTYGCRPTDKLYVILINFCNQPYTEFRTFDFMVKKCSYVI